MLGNNNINVGLEVVSLSCALVGGDTLLSYMPASSAVLISQILNDERQYHVLSFLEELMGKVPIVHIEDVCEAHIFCIEKPSINGRFLCASDYVSTADIVDCSRKYCPDIVVAEE